MRMLLSKSAEGDLALAFLLGNPHIIVDMSTFFRAMQGKWFSPMTGAIEMGPLELLSVRTTGRLGEAVLLMTGELQGDG